MPTVTLRRFYLLLCIDIATRTVYFAGVTDHPSGVWSVTQAARNLLLQYGHQSSPTPDGARARPRQPVHRRLRRDLQNRRPTYEDLCCPHRALTTRTQAASGHLYAPPWRTRSPNAGTGPPCDANSSTAPSSGTAANSTSSSSTTSIMTTRTGPTVHSTSDHPSPPTHQTSQTDTSKP